jgi:hypothetical protein
MASLLRKSLATTVTRNVAPMAVLGQRMMSGASNAKVRNINGYLVLLIFVSSSRFPLSLRQFFFIKI